MNRAAFQSLNQRARRSATDIAGEEVTIGGWTGQAIVNGGPHYQTDVVGGTYDQDVLTIAPTKEDLGDFIPLPQMDVTARGKALRIPDSGIIEYDDRFVITVAGRNVPSR
jgi:hypothetical protein